MGIAHRVVSVLVLPVFCVSFAHGQSQTKSEGALEGIASGKTRIIDLSYAINDKLVAWPGDPRVFEATVNGTVEKDGYFTRSFWMLEHYGTHLDAPAHFPPGKSTVEKIAPEKFFGPAVVLDVRSESAKDADYQLSPAVIEAWEKRNGKIPAGAIVLLRTGWASRWPDVQRYRNTDAKGEMHFPGFSAEAAKILLERKISGLGCDTLSIDPGNSKDFPVHRVVLGAEVYQLENLRDLSSLPEMGASLIVAPIKLEGGSGGAVRVFALVSK
ncbi:MAG TPA: cyclase family protein [Candidatus Angelobacter sp.]|nr:cyclase family protein [Candidatus Angelobacter sp.]